MINWSTLIKKFMQTYIVIVSASILNVSTVYSNGIWHLLCRHYLSKPVLGGHPVLSGHCSFPWGCPLNTGFTVFHLCNVVLLSSVFTWCHGGHIGVPKQWNGRHVGVPNQSSESWTLFLCKCFLLVAINLHRCWPCEWKRSINTFLNNFSDTFFLSLFSEVLGALVSVLIIWVLTGVLVYLAVQRVITRDFDINADIMLITAGIGLGVNIL